MTKLEELLQARENGIKATGCVAVLDIDNFKYINDRFGHGVGDVVLKDYAATLLRYLRKTDVLGWVGGRNSCSSYLKQVSRRRGQ